MLKYFKLFLVLSFFISSNLLAQSFTNSKTENANNFKIINETNDEIIIRFNLNEYKITQFYMNNESFNSILAESSSKILQRGEADLPKFTQSIIIDDNSEMEIEIVDSKFIRYDNINILPSKGNLKRNVNPDTIPYFYANSYFEDSYFPKKLSELGSPYILRDFRAQTINFFPFQYNHLRKTLKVFTQIEIKISKKSSNGQNQFNRSKNSSKSAIVYDEIYKTQFLNYGNQKYTPISEVGDMLIIADSSFIAPMADFVRWKNQSGRKTKIVSVQSIGNSTTAIKSYITSYYNNNNLAFVLLVGDNQQITTNLISSSGHSDNAYGYLSGNDSYPEIIVGRFSTQSIADVETQVERSINYEKYPTLNNAYYKNSIGIASEEGPGYNNLYDYQHMRIMQSDLLAYTYNNNVELFEGSQGGNDANGDPNSTMLVNELNSGGGSILYTGHGSSSSFATTGFSNSNITSLNNANKLPFIYSVACVNGDFVNKTCFAEYWLRSQNQGNPIGAVATMMSTINQSWDPPMLAQQEMMKILSESYSNNIKRTFGGIGIDGCMKMNDNYGSGGDEMTDTWNIFGDPSLMLRTDSASLMTISHIPYLNIGSNSLSVQSNIDGAIATLSLQDSIYSSAIVSNGTASLSFNPISNFDTLKLVVIAYNKIPYEADIFVSANAQAFLSATNVFINDSTSNNNAQADNGENFIIGLKIENLGLASTSNIQMILQSNNPKVNILDSVSNINSISEGDSIIISNAFEVKIDSTFANQENIQFNIKITDLANNTWNSPFGFNVNAPQLQILNYNITEISGNNNGVPNSGESMLLQAEIKNSGSAKLENIIAEFISNSTDIVIINPVVNINQLNADSIAIIDFYFDISQNADDAARVIANLSVGSGIYYDNQNVNLRINIVKEDFETGLSNFIWMQTGDKNWQIDNSTKFEGNHSLRSGLYSNDNNKTSTLSLEIKVKASDSISFYAKVSSEDGSSYNQYWDYLSFSINNQTKKRWQGEVDWHRNSFALSQGIKTLEWTYQKDAYFSSGDDCGWIDYIIFPPLDLDASANNTKDEVYFNLFPNPSSANSKIELRLKKATNIQIQIFDMNGKLVSEIDKGNFDSGTHNIELNFDFINSGVYNVVVKSESGIVSRKLIKM